VTTFLWLGCCCTLGTVVLIGNGGLFKIFGHTAGWLLDIMSFLGGATTTDIASGGQLTTRYTQLQTDAAAGTYKATKFLDGFFAATVTQGQSALAGPLNALQLYAQNVLIDQVNTDTALPSKTLANAISLLIAQMVGATATVNQSAPSLGAQTAGVGLSPVGSCVIVGTVLNGAGLLQEYAFPETLTFACTNDANSGGTANQEPFSLVGQAAASSPFAYNWPLGSGCNTTLIVVDSTQNNAGGNVLNNSDFDTSSNANYADNWVVAVGVAGTDNKQQTATTYTGTGGAMEFLGDGSTLTAITQAFNTTPSTGANSGGTNGTLAEKSLYAFNIFYKLSAASPAAGVLAVSLVNAGGTVINDNAGNANTISVALTGIADTNWHSLSGTFRTPANLPSTVKLRISLTTALTSTKNVYLDHGALALMKAAYSVSTNGAMYGGGPSFAIFSGAVKPLIGDAWTIGVSNTYGIVQREFQRFFGMNALGLLLPSTSSSPTVADSVVA
jgi:hypothetical protein